MMTRIKSTRSLRPSKVKLLKQKNYLRGTSKLTRGISFKVFFSYFVVIAIVAAISVATIYSLNNFQDRQTNFSEESVTYLNNVQQFSKSASDYLVFVERLSSVDQLDGTLDAWLQTGRDIVTNLLNTVKSARQTSSKDDIEIIFGQIFAEVDELVDIKKNGIPPLLATADEKFKALQEAIATIQRVIRRAEVQGRLGGGLDQSQVDLYDRILENSPRLQIALSFVYPITGQTDFSAVKNDFIRATREIINSNVLIKDQRSRSKISQSTSELLKAIDPQDGFFQRVKQVQLLQTRLNDTVQRNYKLENQLNDAIANLVSEANAQTQRELKFITELVQSDVRKALISLALALLVATLIILFFVNPQIVNRLKKLARDTSIIASGELDQPIVTTGTDEISNMGFALEDFRQKLIEKEKNEAQIRENEALLSNIFSNAADGMMMIDQHGKILSFNQSCEKIFGIESADVLGSKADQFIADLAVNAGEAKSNGKTDGSNPSAANVSYQLVGTRADGSNFPLEITTSEVEQDGSVTILCILTDVSERIRLQTEREELIQSLSASNTQLAQFAYVCSHDLQEPMRMISAFSGKLKDRLLQIDSNLVDDEKLSIYLSQLTKGASNGQALIRGILEYSKLDHEKTAFEAVDCNEVVQDIRKVLEADEQHQILVEGKLPIVKGVRTQIYQLFSNLISNGLKYVAPDKTPTVKIASSDFDQEYCTISFTDNGIGIDEKNQKSIFEIFRRLHRRDEFPGTGIGLSICKKIVETHRGTITVSSQMGAGSTFKITLLKQ